jgi:hypothetical protein
MSPRQLFGIIVRVAGLWVTYNGLVSLVGLAMASLSPMFRFTPSGASATVSNMLGGALVGLAIFSVLQLLAGLWLLRGAPQLVEYAYREGDVGRRVPGMAPLDVRG